MKYTALVLFALASASPALAQSSLDGTVKNGPFWPQTRRQCSNSNNVCEAYTLPGRVCSGMSAPSNCQHADPKDLPDVCMVMDQVGVVNGIDAATALKTPGMIFPCSMSDDDMLQEYFAAHMAPAPGGGWRSR